MIDFCVEQDDSLDNPALLGEILGAAGINIEGLCLITSEGRCIIHFVVEDAVTAKSALEDAGLQIMQISDVFVLHKDEKHVTGKPRSFGRICRTLTDHGLRINFGYPAENNRFIFGVDDVAKAKELLG